jgi:hypothetical protein
LLSFSTSSRNWLATFPADQPVKAPNVTALAEAAATRKRWAFQFMAAPLPIRTGTGSPINPLAVF